MLLRLLLMCALSLMVTKCGSAVDPNRDESIPADEVDGNFSCPAPFRYSSQSRLCEASDQALGPFAAAMIRRCQEESGGEACLSERWNLDFAMRIRGTNVCPYGTTKDQGFCAEGDHVFGPFTREQVQACQNKGGNACSSMRWGRLLAASLKLQDRFTFPYSGPALEKYTEAPKSFGSCRDDCQRRHAGVDLYANTSTMIRAVGDGEVIDFYEFYLGTYALIVDHGDFIVRYGEIKAELPKGITVGTKIKRGQGIAYVGRLVGLTQDMLHFERFTGKAQGPLTLRDNYPYQRRSDLVNPTQDLLAWKYPQ